MSKQGIRARMAEIGEELRNRSETAVRRFHVARLLAQNVVWPRRLKPPARKTPVIVSLTTYPGRLGKVWATIETILRQRDAPDSVMLWLSEDEISPAELPAPLLRQCKRGLEIKFVSGNHRSYKKLIYAAAQFPDSIIITADDDVLYPTSWLTGLMACHEEDPDAVICYRGRTISYGTDGKLLPYDLWPLDDPFPAPSLKLIPIGVSGVLYPPNSLDPKYLKPESFMKICATGDDIWFKAMTLAAGIACRKVLKESVHFPTIPGSQETSLFSINRENRTDQQIKDVFRAFNLESLHETDRAEKLGLTEAR